ncbi:helix-turn-helix domain-containing protein [Streptomyces zhihengii]
MHRREPSRIATLIALKEVGVTRHGMRAAGIAEAYPWRLRELIQGRRRYLRLSQEAVAARLEISARAYGNWERGVVKEWTDQKLYSLAEALEMTQFQTVRLFRLAVDRVPQPQLRSPVRGMSTGTSVSALLEDYRVLIEAQSLPAFLIDHGWNVRMSNGAFRMLFEGVSRRPASMPPPTSFASACFILMRLRCSRVILPGSCRSLLNWQ